MAAWGDADGRETAGTAGRERAGLATAAPAGAELKALRKDHGRTHAIGLEGGVWVATDLDHPDDPRRELRRASAAGLDLALRITAGARS